MVNKIVSLALIHFRGTESSPYSISAKDCVNGTWFSDQHFEPDRKSSYSRLIDEFAKRREVKEHREEKIDFEMDIIIYNRTK